MRKIYIPIILLLFCSFVSAQGRVKSKLSLKIITAKTPWSDSELKSKMRSSFSSNPKLNINIISENTTAEPEFPQNYYDIQNLASWGAEVGSRFIMIVDVQNERIEKRKTFHLPLIFHKFETIGVIEGEARLFDVQRNKLLLSYHFIVEKKGSRVLQATMDDDKNDPDLHISAPRKVRFFSKLEDKLVKELKDKTKVYLGIR